MLKACVIGNIGSEPEMRYAASGSAVLRFSVASNYRVKGQLGDWQDATEWVRVTVFGKRAETLSGLLRKGTRVYVDGRLEARPWTDNQGNVRAGLEITANEVELCSPRAADDSSQPRPAPAARGNDDDTSDLPF